jgi:ribose transport system substrate-binding protein
MGQPKEEERQMPRTSRILIALALIALSSLAIAACGGDSDEGGGDGGQEIALLTGDNIDPFFITMNAGAQDKADELGVSVNWQGPAKYEPAEQIKVLDSVMQQDPDFLLVAPTDVKALSQPLSQVKDQGTPIITVDTDVDATEVRLGNITSDNELGGKVAAQYIVDKIGGEGKVLLLNQAPGISTLDARQKGFEEELAKDPGIEYLGVEYTQDDPAKTAAAVGASLQKDPDLKGIFAIDTLTAEGVATGIANAGKEDQIVGVGFDGSPSEVEAVRNGSLDALIVQRAYDMGTLAIQYAVDYLEDGTEPPPQKLLDYVVADRSNLDKPEVQKYLYRAK